MYQTVYTSTSTAPAPVALKPAVLVIGGGLVGLTVARELAREGIHVDIVEKGETLGGGIRQLHFFHDRPTDVQTWTSKLIAEVESSGNIAVHRGKQLARLEGHLGRFQARIRGRDGSENALSPSVIVVATGCLIRIAEVENGEDRVIGLSDMERLLAGGGNEPLLWKGQSVRTVTYLLDKTNEDVKIHTVNAIKQALILQDKGCQVAVAARDLKVSVSGMEKLYRKAREKGVLFFKYDEPPVISRHDGKITVDIPDLSILRKGERDTVSLRSDLVVVGETFAADPAGEELCRLLKLRPGTDGMLMDDNPQLQRVSSNRRGIFLAGACRFPQIVTESLSEAHAVIHEVTALVLKGEYAHVNPVAEVDPPKCAVCYTCVRLCPHAAITIEQYGERNVYAQPSVDHDAASWGAARVDPAACYGCGVCIAECPARAISLHRLDVSLRSEHVNL